MPQKTEADSEERNLEKKERLAFLLAAALIIGCLAINPVEKFIQSYEEGSSPENQNKLTMLSLIVLVFQAWVFHRQANISNRLAEISDRQVSVAQRMAEIEEERLRVEHRPLIFPEEILLSEEQGIVIGRLIIRNMGQSGCSIEEIGGTLSFVEGLGGYAQVASSQASPLARSKILLAGGALPIDFKFSGMKDAFRKRSTEGAAIFRGVIRYVHIDGGRPYWCEFSHEGKGKSPWLFRSRDPQGNRDW